MGVALIKEVMPPREALCDSCLPSERRQFLWTIVAILMMVNGALHFFLEIWS